MTLEQTSVNTSHYRVIIVGSGFAGLGTAIQMKRAGMHDFIVLERGNDVGGTWRDNTYPGAACDVPSLLYSFSFAPNPDWSRSFSPQAEIQAYLQDCAERFDVTPHVRLNEQVIELRWVEADQCWQVLTTTGQYRAQFVVGGMGGLSEPQIPDLPGLSNFTGDYFHSATWDHDVALEGKRVAVIGTGASAIQFVPEIQPVVGQLDVYQRTPAWIAPRWDRNLSSFEKALYRRFPWLQRVARTAIYWGRETYAIPFIRHRPNFKSGAERIARRNLRKVKDPVLREKLTPDFAAGCKRMLLSNDWYPALQQPNVEVVTTGISEIRAGSIVDNEGVEREVDTIIFGTGFQIHNFPHGHHVFGRDGRSMAEHWSQSMEAYLGTAVVGFPNLFLLAGPNTGLGHSSMVFMLESQINYVVDMLRNANNQRLHTVEVRSDVAQLFNAEIHERMPRTVWMAGGCDSWYLDPSGRNTTLWPDFSWKFRLRTRRFRTADYHVQRTTDRPRVPSA